MKKFSIAFTPAPTELKTLVAILANGFVLPGVGDLWGEFTVLLNLLWLVE